MDLNSAEHMTYKVMKQSEVMSGVNLSTKKSYNYLAKEIYRSFQLMIKLTIQEQW